MQGADEHYQAIEDSWKPIMNSQPEIVHVDFEPVRGLQEAISAPVTEVATFSFDGSPPEDAYQNVEKAVEVLKKAGATFQGWAYGSTHEIIEKNGIKGKSAVLIGGWESIEKHNEVRAMQAFKENMHLLGNGTKGVEVHHVQFKMN